MSTTTPTPPPTEGTPAPTDAAPAAGSAGNGDVLTPGHIDVGADGLAAGSAAWRGTVITFFATLLVCVASLLAFVAWVDPWGIVGEGTGRFGLHHFDGVNRAQKAELIRKLPTAPDVLVLGSSTIRNIDPAEIHRLTGGTAFNASVSAGKPIDNYVFTRYLDERFDAADFPHVVYGVDVEATFFETAPNPGLRTTPELWRQLPRRDQLRLLPQMYRTYTSLDTLRESWDIVRRTREEGVFGATSIEPASLRMSPDGYRLVDPYRRAKLAVRLPNETARYRDTVYATNEPARLGRRSRDYFRRIVSLANERGDTPTLVLFPAHPDARRQLTPYGWADRRDAIVDYLESLDDELDVTVVDLSDIDSFGASPDGFVDNAHMTVENTNRLLAELDSRGALARTR